MGAAASLLHSLPPMNLAKDFPPAFEVLSASLMQPLVLSIMLLAQMLPDVTAGNCMDDAVFVCLQRCQHCQLSILLNGIMPLC